MADPATDVPATDTAQQYLKAPDVPSRPPPTPGGGDNIVEMANYRQPNADQDIKNLTGSLIPMTQQKMAAGRLNDAKARQSGGMQPQGGTNGAGSGPVNG